MIRYHARWVVPVCRPPIEYGTVAVEGERIAFVGSRAEAPAGVDADLGHTVLLPGLVNAHTHLELTALRGFLDGLDFPRWLATLVAAKRDVLFREDLLDSARLGVAEGLRAGITTYADTCESGVALDAMVEAGVRGVMYQEVFGPAPEQCEQSMTELRAKVAAVAARATPRVRIGASPHAPYSVSDALFAAATDYARVEGLPVAIHIAESVAESSLVARGDGPFAEAHRKRGIPVAPRGLSPVAMLERVGALAARPLLIHCVRVDDRDVRRIARHRCAVAHCPASNAKLGHGIAPLRELLDAGIPVGLGSDSMASNNHMDLLGEARLAVLLQHTRLGRAGAVAAGEALALATLGGACALGLDDEIGSLAPGKQADLAAFPLGESRLTPLADPVSALVFALAGGRASHVLVAGKVLVRHGQLLNEDAPARATVERAAARLASWRRAHDVAHRP